MTMETAGGTHIHRFQRLLRELFQFDCSDARSIPAHTGQPSPFNSYNSFTFPPPGNVRCASCRNPDKDALSYRVGQIQVGDSAPF